ncbi:DNA-binding transcriptional ArsR family regulator [Arthrobacter agilis]|nr:DNA-binding transcriptional ArsR family regulator [Arthrobacter agilis]
MPTSVAHPFTGNQGLTYHGGVADIYRALADETRRALLDELLQRDRQTLFELCSKLAMHHDLTPSRQAVAQHLDVLEAAGLVHSERSGRYRFHTIDTSPLVGILDRWPPRKAEQ